MVTQTALHRTRYGAHTSCAPGLSMSSRESVESMGPGHTRRNTAPLHFSVLWVAIRHTGKHARAIREVFYSFCMVKNGGMTNMTEDILQVPSQENRVWAPRVKDANRAHTASPTRFLSSGVALHTPWQSRQVPPVMSLPHAAHASWVAPGL